MIYIPTKALDLNKFKQLYVKERVNDNKFEMLNNDILKIHCFGELDKEGYEHSFLYLKNGAVFDENNEDVMILYKSIIDDKSQIQVLDSVNKIASVDNDIVEIFTMNKNKIDCSEDTLNDTLYRQAKRYLWRIDQLLPYFALDKEDIQYKNFDYLSWLYDISKDTLKEMNDIYFYKRDYIPYKNVNLLDLDISYHVIPYVVENAYNFKVEGFQPPCNDGASFENINKRQAKSLSIADKIYTK